MKSSVFSAALLSLSVISALVVAVSPLPAQAVDINPSTTSLKDGILPNCDPKDTNIKDGGDGCGVQDALQLVYNIIKYVTYIIIPIAILLLGYAGFTIMTSAGSTEKVGQAKHMINLVLIGLGIIFLSALIVRYVFIALQANTTP